MRVSYMCIHFNSSQKQKTKNHPFSQQKSFSIIHPTTTNNMLGSSSDEQGDMSSSTDMLPDLVGELTNSGSAGTYGILSTGSDDDKAAEADADGPASTSSFNP